MEAAERELAAAWEAVGAWDGEVSSITELARSENVVFRVDLVDGTRRVLRLHRPGYTSKLHLDAEVAWVRSLAESGVPVPTPVPRSDGGYYTRIDVDGVPHQVGMISWVDGRPVRETGEPPAPHFRSIGELSARIRLHNSTWQPPSTFERRRWDADALMGDSPFWGRFWEADGLSQAERTVLSDARVAMLDELGGLSIGPDRFGLIHADLHLGNVMADGGRICVIDFDDSGFGWYAHELGVSLQAVVDTPDFVEARRQLLEGYRSVTDLDPDEETTIDTFILVRRLMLIGWLDARRNLDEGGHHFRGLVDAGVGAASEWLGRR